jgi:hypothetical protein
MYTNNRDTYRETFFNLWEKHKKKLPLEPMESQLLSVILQHPEYHRFLEASNQSEEFALEENPFFHMSLHLAIREQINTNRPEGISLIHQQLLAKEITPHECEHIMMECLTQMMWQLHQTGNMPAEDEYLSKLREAIP